MLNEQGVGNEPLFRFVYEKRRSDPNEGLSKFFPITSPTLISGRAAVPTVTLKAMSKTSPTTFSIANVAGIELHDAGGGSIGADNWYLNEIKLTIVTNGVETQSLKK